MSDGQKLPLKSVGWLTLLKLATAVVGLLQTIVIAWLFGVTRAVEIFFAATTFQQLLMQLTSTGQIGDLFTPIYHNIQAQQGAKPARDAFSAMTNVMVLCAAIVAAIAVLLAQPISSLLVPGFGEQDLALTARVFVAVAPIIVVMIANAMYSNLLRAEHRYGISEVLALTSRVVNLLILFCLASSLGVWALILGLWISALIHFLGQWWCAHRNNPQYRFILSSEHFHPRIVLFKLPLAFTHIFSAQFFVFALTATLTMLPEGSFATYSYAQRLRSKFQGLVLQPIGIVFFNHFSQSLAEGTAKVRSYAEHALGLTIAVVALCIVPIAAGGDLLLSGLWGSENFPPERIQESYWILCALTALLVFNAQYLIARRTNLALKVVGRQFAATGTVVILSAFACYWLIPRYGLVGAVVIQAVVAAGNAAVTLVVLSYVRRDLVCLIPLGLLLQWIVAVAVSVSFAWLLRSLIPQVESLSAMASIGAGAAVSTAGLVCLAVLSLALRIPEAHEILDKLRQKIRRAKNMQANA